MVTIGLYGINWTEKTKEIYALHSQQIPPPANSKLDKLKNIKQQI